MTRRELFRAALALPAGAWMAHYEALAQAERRRVRITAVKAVLLRGTGQSLIKVETDAGLTGFGEAGISGAAARARIELLKGLLVGQDPLAIEHLFHRMSTQMHAYRAHIPTVSGIDMALWDLAGKILNLPVCRLLGGPFRDQIRMTLNSQPRDPLDPASCREWAARLRADPNGWNCFKIGYMRLTNQTPDRLASALTAPELYRIERAFHNIREAIGPESDLVPHGHNELDLHGAIGLAQAVEAIKPLWVEDPMPVAWSESWMMLRRSVRVPIQTGEKLELANEFHPFLHNHAVDSIQPDLAFAGGITGVRKIADLAALYRIPLCLHNIGSPVHISASLHFGASIYNFVTSEVVPRAQFADLAPGAAFQAKNSRIDVPQTPGLGIELNPEAVRREMAPGEPWWG
ncbi:MAG: mandelate racemase/muconate lactonizing enzyme family protein [Bryobacterales bacterium]|nr:mandelate racemase/muconate lactonizing enzyme family protein [Bryobacterales bacterium]